MDLDSALTGKPAAGDANALDLLRADHDEMRRLAAQYRDAAAHSVHARHAVVEAFAMQADLHTRVEDGVFYPAVRHLDPAWVDRARGEHDEIAAAIASLEGLEPTSEAYARAAERLVALVLHHIEEEERVLFPHVRHRLGAELVALADAITKCKEALTRSTKDLEGPAT